MKSLITKRIITLMTITIILSGIAFDLVGMFLSQDLLADIRGKKMIPDISVLTQCTIEYQAGNISKEVYESIINNGIEPHSRAYIIYGNDQEVVISTNNQLLLYKEKEFSNALKKVYEGEEVFVKNKGVFNEPIDIVGVPIIKDNQVIGAVFVYEDIVDLIAVRKRFYVVLLLSLLIVVPIVQLISYFILMKIIKPIRNIVKVALQMTEGDFSIRADETLEGEIGFLGRTMNQLSVELYRNVSQLFVEKNRLDQVLNSLDEGMLSIDENMTITHYNNSLLDMFKLSGDDIGSKSLEELFAVNDDLTEVRQVIEGKYPLIKTRTYGESILRVSISPIENEKNIVVGAVVIFRDITEFEKLESMRRDYVANVSHELRSPLTSIRGLIEPLMDSIVTNEADVKRYYEIIYRESLRLSRLVDDIMELSRLQSNDSLIEKQYINLNTVIEMVYERFRLYDEEIILIFNPMDLPEVYSNYDRIEQILVILLDNAYKFTSKGGRIEIITEPRINDVLVRVVDSGVGISEEDIPYVFDRFYKSDKSRTKKGTGLGLSIAKEIMNIMGEEIYVKSKKGVGSSFEFTVHLI